MKRPLILDVAFKATFKVLIFLYRLTLKVRRYLQRHQSMFSLFTSKTQNKKYANKPLLYIACVGHDYKHEAKSLIRWMKKKRLTNDNCRVLVFSHDILPLLREQLSVLYFPDIVSETEEIELFSQAYKLIREISDYINSQEPEFAPFLAAMHHSWASSMFSMLVLKNEMDKITNKNVKTTIAVVDIPWRSKGIFLLSLNYAWGYDFMDNSWPIRFLDLFRNIRAISRIQDILYRQEQKYLGKFSPYYDHEEDTPRTSQRKTVLVLVEDSGTFINLTSAKAFIIEMKRRKENPIILTSTVFVAEQLEDTGCRIYRTPYVLSSREYKNFAQSLAKLKKVFDTYILENKSILWDFFSEYVRADIYSFFNMTINIKKAIECLCAKYIFSSVIIFGEGYFLPCAAFSYLATRNIKTIGIEGVLVKEHPSCHFWPAQEHLVYGDQMEEILISAGYPADTIHIVGSEHFDRCRRRDKADDIKCVRNFLPQSEGKKLVVIATENRPRQMIEIEPSVKVMAKYPKFFTVIKVHPSETVEPFIQLLKEIGNPPNIVVIGKEMETLPIVHAADLLVTMYSNVIIEAGVMGTIPLVHNYSGEPCPIDFVKEGLCFGAYSIEEFEKLAIALLEDANLRREAYNKLKLISRYNGPNDGQAIKRMVDFVLRKE